MPAAGWDRLVLPARLRDRMLDHARECLPEECCGILIGSETTAGRRRVADAVAARNVNPSARERAYRVSPRAILEAFQTARSAGLEIVGYYHSHPSGSARPSAVDLRDAWPDTSYVILAFQSAELWEMRSWRLVPEGTGFVEETLTDERDSR